MLKIATGSRGPFLGLEFGSFGPLWLRQETFCWGMPRPCSLLYASDLHLGRWWTRPVPGQILQAVDRLRPDVLLLGGDLVDVPAALPEFHRFVAELTRRTIVAGVPGNHDCRDLEGAFRGGGGRWLPGQPLLDPVAVDGKIENGSSRGVILCTHYPSDFPKAEDAGYRLVLAGHLHGGQCVLPWRGDKQYPAAWLHRWHGLRFEGGQATMLVSRGVGDTLPLRFNCPRELLFCRLE